MQKGGLKTQAAHFQWLSLVEELSGAVEAG
jgi:hypothetical protein